MKPEDVIRINRERLAIIRAPYNQLTGEGSNAVPRELVLFDDAPLKKMWLPASFVQTGFVQTLIKFGFKGYIQQVLKRGVTNDLMEMLWIEFCKERNNHDFEYFAIEGLNISEKGTGRDINFSLNRAQRYYLSELEKLRLAGKPIDIILLKARQWGGSTITQLYMLWIQLFLRGNWNSVICGHVETAARNVSGMLQKAVDKMPLWVTGGALRTSPYQGSAKTRTISSGKSRYSVGSAERPEGLRSEDISMAHLTEVGLWKATKGKKPEDLVQALFGAILSGDLTVKVMESTAKGVGNYFHRTWVDAVSGKNNFTPVFVPWFLIDIYSKKIPTQTYYKFVTSMTEREMWLFEKGATLEAINWYRDKSKEMSDEWRMCSEYPTTAAEAFQSTGRRVFPIKYVENIRKTCIEPSFYGEFEGLSNKGKEALKNVRFIELKPTSDKENILWVWQLPDYTELYNDRYIVSVDVGGVSETSDPSCITVMDRLPMLEIGGLPEVVAEWHGHIEHDLLVWKAAQIATAYQDALLVIESNTLETDGTEGDNFEYILDEIVEHYDNLYSRTTVEQIKQGVPKKYGFHTNVKTKPLVINFFKSAMRDFMYIERCMETTFECDTFELKENGKETGAVDGCHDDRVIAKGICVYVCYKWPAPTKKIVSSGAAKKTRIVSEASM